MTKLLAIQGKKVVDAKKAATLHITPADVKLGKKRRPDCCAAAEACKRQFGAKQAIVHLSRVYIETAKNWIRFRTPPNLRTEIVSFDRGHAFSSGDYLLGKIQPTAMLGPKKSPKGRSTGTRPRRKVNMVYGVRHAAGMGA